MNGGQLPTNYDALDHASRASQLMPCITIVCVCVCVCVCVHGNACM